MLIAGIGCAQNVPKDLLWQIGKRIGILELLQFDTHCGELSLDEMEPDSQFLLIVEAQLELSCCCRRNGLTNLYRHVG